MNFLKSKTLWTSVIVALLPYTDVITGITSGVSPLAGAVIGGVFMVLRVITKVPLSEK